MIKPLTLLALALATTAGCVAQPPVTPNPMTKSVDVTPDAVVASGGLNGKKTIAINVVAPQDATFRTLAAVHKWVENDVFEYRVTLKAWDGTAYADFATPLTVTIPRKGPSPKNRAVFTNLKHGLKYQVSLVALGNNGGTAATQTQTSIPATGVFDFTAAQDVEDTQSANLQVVFDSVPFSGTGTTAISAPGDGTFTNPSEPETGVAE